MISLIQTHFPSSSASMIRPILKTLVGPETTEERQVRLRAAIAERDEKMRSACSRNVNGVTWESVKKSYRSEEVS